MLEDFLAPMAGKLVPLVQVPDPVFADKIMGDGFAIDPASGDVISPVDGTITSFMTDTRHAVGITADDGTEVLIHIGIDTVTLGGAGFTSLVAQEDRVKAGQLLLQVDLAQIKAKVPSLVTPVVFTNLPAGLQVSVAAGREIERGEKGFFSIGWSTDGRRIILVQQEIEVTNPTGFHVGPAALLKIKKIITSVEKSYAQDVAAKAMRLSTVDEIVRHIEA